MRYSIIIPIYNVEKYIRQCIDSVLTQTFHDYEIILVNDGSPDKCPIICDDYASKYDRIKVIHKKNGGLSDARNTGLEIAQGEYVIFIDSDDWWDDTEALCKINKNIEKQNPDIIIFGMKKYFIQDRKVRNVNIPQKINTKNLNYEDSQDIQHYMKKNIFIACACDKVVRRELINKHKLRFVKGQYSEDIEWCCNLLLYGAKMEVLEDSFYVYRQQVSTSITANVGIKNIKCILDVIERYATKDVPIPLLHFLANQYVLLITNFMRLSKGNRKLVERRIKSLWWLLNFNWYPYAKKVSKVKFLGFDLTKYLLRAYYQYKRKK